MASLVFFVLLGVDAGNQPAEPPPPSVPYLAGLVKFEPRWNVGPEDVPQPSGSTEPLPPPYVWPVAGPITKYFAANHPLGIDIGLAATPAQPIRAIAAGRVLFTGGDPCCSYGYHVIVDHGGGLTSLYAHLRQIDVQVGELVTQNQQLGISGDTGFSTAEHLHLEIRRNEEYLDPLTFLPPPACRQEGGLYHEFASPDGNCPPVW